jgi:octaprenyl-diphosphate synthase
VGGSKKNVMSLALAFELMHTATLVHDDIIDGDNCRRDIPALHKKWSVNDAILTGNALIALSVELASAYGESILKAVARSALELCDGEHMDTTFSLSTTTEESYFRMIREKSASLFAAATYCGALAGGGTPSEIDSLTKFGENFGTAYQLRDDLLDLTQKETAALKDLRSGRITLPLIHSYANSDQNGKKSIEDKLRTLTNENREIENETAENLMRILHQTGSLDYCKKKMDDHLYQAVASIAMLQDTEYKAYLVEMTKALKTWG